MTMKRKSVAGGRLRLFGIAALFNRLSLFLPCFLIAIIIGTATFLVHHFSWQTYSIQLAGAGKLSSLFLCGVLLGMTVKCVKPAIKYDSDEIMKFILEHHSLTGIRNAGIDTCKTIDADDEKITAIDGRGYQEGLSF